MVSDGAMGGGAIQDPGAMIHMTLCADQAVQDPSALQFLSHPVRYPETSFRTASDEKCIAEGKGLMRTSHLR